MSTMELWVVLMAVSTTTVLVLAVYARQEHERAERQQQRADEWWMWAEEHRREADAARAQLREMERMHANLQTLYTDLVRRRLAENFAVIAGYTSRKRQRGR